MKKILGFMMMVGLLAMPSHASDNRSAPNVFSSGSTISSSKMNENFNFLASEMREKSVYCDNGETINDAINEGYNSLIIYGTCDGAFMVYQMDPTPFGINLDDLPNKPISHLRIKGGGQNRSSTISNTSGGMTSMVTTTGFLQLINLTFNDKLNVSDGSVLFIDDIFYSVQVSGESNKLSAYGSSYMGLKNSTVNSELQISTGSVGNIENSIINKPESEYNAISIDRGSYAGIESSTISGQLSIWMGASCEIEESTIDGTINIGYQSVGRLEDTALNGDGNNNRTLKITHNSHAGLKGTTSINGFAGEDQTIWLWNNSTIEIQDTSTVSAPSGARAIGIQQNSAAILSNNPTINSIDETTITLDTNGSLEINDDSQITRTDDTSNTEIFIDATSAVNINGNSTMNGDISCGAITSHINTGGENTSVNIDSNCNGYQNLIPNFIKVTTGTCESNGYQELYSQHECALAYGGRIRSEEYQDDPTGCFEQFYNGVTHYYYNNTPSDVVIDPSNRGLTSKYCKQ